MMAEGEMIDVRDLPERLRTRGGEKNDEGSDELLPLAELERRHVLRVLEHVGGNKVQAAKILGIDPATELPGPQRYQMVSPRSPFTSLTPCQPSGPRRSR